MAKANETANATPATPEVDPVKEAKKKAYQEAKVVIRKFMADDCKDDDLKAALTIVVGSGTRGGGGVRSSAKTAVIEMILEKGELDEGTIFTEHKLGRTEMRWACVDLIKKAKTAEERVWISFDPVAGLYKLVSTGAEPPKGWTGYRPVDIEDIKLD